MRCSKMPRLATVVALVAFAGAARADHWIDMPAWPKPMPAVAHLRWVLQPAPADGKRPITLEVEADGITRAVVLDPRIGELRTAPPLRKGEVAELAFFETGFAGYAV